MEHIVVGFDGSSPSSVALGWVAERAARGPCLVEIVTVGHADPLAEPGMIARDAERIVTDRASAADVVTRQISGRMPDALLHVADGADLLVIGAHRHHPVRSALTGWLPLRTVARSAVATIVVPDDWTFRDGPVVVGVDDDDSSAVAVPFAAREAVASGASITVLHAWQMPAPTTEGAGALLASTTHVKAFHRELLDRAAEPVAELYPGLPLETLLVTDNPSAALVARSAYASVLVLGTHHRGLLEGAVLGSVCQDVLWLADTPVCVVPARA